MSSDKNLHEYQKTHEIIEISLNLISVEVDLRLNYSIIDFKEHFVHFFNILFDSLDFENKKIIDSIYMFEETKIHNEKLFHISMDYNKNYYAGDSELFTIFKLIYKLDCIKMEFIEPIASYNYFNQRDKLENSFDKLMIKLMNKIDLPKSYIYKICHEYRKEIQNCEAKVNDIDKLGQHSWLNKKIEKAKKENNQWDSYGNKNSLKSFLKKHHESKGVEDQFIEVHNTNKRSPADSSRILWRRMSILFNTYSDYDLKKHTFNSFNIVGLKELRKQNTDSFDKNNFSKIINNHNIVKLFRFFPELGIKGVINESELKHKVTPSRTAMKFDNKCDDKYIGDPVLQDLTIEVSKCVMWDSNYNKELESLICYYGINLKQLSYDKELKPIIKI